ncbi:MAG: glycosyl hydrolase family 3 [Cyanobacteria bacterium K_DeepCast_35m_m2_023]|nr:glycosyl hydrolase family 3 [Cyanobacteria bacterium K_DeepCast_35m_m2_023]
MRTLIQLVASLLVMRASGHLLDSQRRYPQWELANAELRNLLELGVGGVILLGGSAAEVALRCQQLQNWANEPLLLCADVEEGVGQRFEGATWLPAPLGLGRLYRHQPQWAVELAERYGHCCGREARQLGLNWVLGPVCDVNNNPTNPVINVRAWGETPEEVAALTVAFTRGLGAAGVLGCAKHFPGHGDTSVDSHLALPVLSHSSERLASVELPPFQACIDAGIAAVMTAHLTLPALDPDRPATLSRSVLHDLLRHKLGFDGLVVTDALVMEAISGHYGAGEAAVLAVEAGADLVLMPADAREAIHAIAAAVSSGRLSRAQLEASAQRRNTALTAVSRSLAHTDPEGAAASPTVSLAEPDQVLSQTLLEATLEHHGGTVQRALAGGINLIRLDNCLAAPQASPQMPAIDLPAAQGFQTRLLEPRSPRVWSDDLDAPLALERLGQGPVLLQLFVRGTPFRGSSAGLEPWPQVVQQLQELGRLAGLVVYGSPYLWEQLQPLLHDTVAAAYSPGQMPQAQSVALGALGLGHTEPPSRNASDFTD